MEKPLRWTMAFGYTARAFFFFFFSSTYVTYLYKRLNVCGVEIGFPYTLNGIRRSLPIYRGRE